MKELISPDNENIYLRITSSNDISHMLKNKDKKTYSKLAEFLLKNFEEEEIYIGGSAIENFMCKNKKPYNDIDILIVSSSSHNYIRIRNNINNKLEALVNVNKKISELNPTGEFPRYILKNKTGTDFDINFDYKKIKNKSKTFGFGYQ